MSLKPNQGNYTYTVFTQDRSSKELVPVPTKDLHQNDRRIRADATKSVVNGTQCFIQKSTANEQVTYNPSTYIYL